MAYDNSSFNGNELCHQMDEQNNFLNPPTPTGWFFYNLFKSFDNIDALISESINNRVLESAKGLYLDINWGKKYNIKRNGLNDELYRKILIAATYETITIYGIKNTLSTILGCEYDSIIITEEYQDIARATNNLTLNEDYTVPDFMTDPEMIEKFVTDRLKKSVGSLLVKYPVGLNTEIDEETTLLDLIKPYIGLVNITYEEYVA